MDKACRELTPQQIEVIRAVLKTNHDYYVNHPNYPMPEACMWPDEIMCEIVNALRHKSVSNEVETST